MRNGSTHGLRVAIVSKWDQYQISSRWNDITHFLRVENDRNEVSIKLLADAEWQYARAESWNWSKWAQYKISSRRNGITHILRVNIGRNEVSIQLAAHGMSLRTGWEWTLVATRSASDYRAAERMALHTRCNLKPDQYRINSPWNAITHVLRVQIGRDKVSVKLAADGIPWRTRKSVASLKYWEFKLAEARSLSN